jgi:hypothetical protein
LAHQSLEELKAENALLEEQTTETTQVEVEESDELDAVEEVTSETDGLGEGSEEVDSETETEAWMQTEEQASENADAKFTDGDVAAAKSKLRAKMERQHNSELDELRAEIQTLKQVNQPVQTEQRQMPTLESSGYDEAKYQAEMQSWVTENAATSVNAVVQKQQQAVQRQQAVQHLESSVDQHYERAAKLVNETGIKPEVYQAADATVRQMVETVYPNGGDAVVDGLISNLGDGSEKVMYYLGRNQKAMSELKAKFVSDPSGISASIYLGKLAGEKLTPQKRVSRTPKPAATASGDTQGESASTRKLIEKYQRAHKKGNHQESYNLRKEAKAAGVDVSNW